VLPHFTVQTVVRTNAYTGKFIMKASIVSRPDNKAKRELHTGFESTTQVYKCKLGATL